MVNAKIYKYQKHWYFHQFSSSKFITPLYDILSSGHQWPRSVTGWITSTWPSTSVGRHRDKKMRGGPINQKVGRSYGPDMGGRSGGSTGLKVGGSTDPMALLWGGCTCGASLQIGQSLRRRRAEMRHAAWNWSCVQCPIGVLSHWRRFWRHMTQTWKMMCYT